MLFSVDYAAASPFHSAVALGPVAVHVLLEFQVSYVSLVWDYLISLITVMPDQAQSSHTGLQALGR